MFVSKATQRPSILIATLCLLMFLTAVVSWSLASHHQGAGSCAATGHVAEPSAPRNIGLNSEPPKTHEPDAGITAAHPLAIVYLAQKVHSSYGADTMPMLRRSLDLLYANVIPHTPADILIFHEGKRETA